MAAARVSPTDPVHRHPQSVDEPHAQPHPHERRLVRLDHAGDRAPLLPAALPHRAHTGRILFGREPSEALDARIECLAGRLQVDLGERRHVGEETALAGAERTEDRPLLRLPAPRLVDRVSLFQSNDTRSAGSETPSV